MGRGGAQKSGRNKMGILSVVGGLVKPVTEAIATHQQGKVELKKLEIETKKALAVAQIEAIREGRVQTSNWELEALKQQATSWKDEYLLVLFSIPLIGAFIPGIDYYILRGFNILAKMPDWYMYSLGAIISSIVGIRSVLRLFKK